MKFKIEINCDNAAFSGTEFDRGGEVSRILYNLAYRAKTEGVRPADYWPVYDVNGNEVGTAKVTKR